MLHCSFRGWPVVLVTLLALCGPVLAAEAATLSFVPASTDLNCRQEGVVDLWIDGTAGDLRGFSIVVEFDPVVVEPVAVQVGPLLVDAPCPSFERWNNATAVGDSVWFDAASLGCSVSGPGPIARFRFLGLADGATPLQVRRATLRDGENQPIGWAALPGQLVVSCPVGQADRSWSTLKAGFR